MKWAGWWRMSTKINAFHGLVFFFWDQITVPTFEKTFALKDGQEAVVIDQWWDWKIFWHCYFVGKSGRVEKERRHRTREWQKERQEVLL